MDIIISILCTVGSVALDAGKEIGFVVVNSAVQTLTRELNIAIIESFRGVNLVDFYKDLFVQPVYLFEEPVIEHNATVELEESTGKIIINRHIHQHKYYMTNIAYLAMGASMATACIYFGTTVYYSDAVSYIFNNMIFKPK
jgi:hypothetical protein